MKLLINMCSTEFHPMQEEEAGVKNRAGRVLPQMDNR